MSYPSCPIEQLSLRFLIGTRIREALLQWLNTSPQQCVEDPIHETKKRPIGNLTELEIPLNKVKDHTCVWYVSAIALKLSTRLHIPASTIAQSIALHFFLPVGGGHRDSTANTTAYPSTSETIWPHCSIQVAPPGWIYVRISELGLGLWLQTLTGGRLLPHEWAKPSLYFENDNQFFRNSTSLFKIQYSHARCGSLMRLAAESGLITLSAPTQTDRQAPAWQILQPSPIPWKDPQQKALRLQHPTEKQLIGQLIHTVDEAFRASQPLPPETALALATALSDSFQVFYAACRMLGNADKTNPHLAQSRLGLVWITQALLRLLLENQIGVCAPAEL